MGRRWDRFRELATREDRRLGWSAAWIALAVLVGGAASGLLTPAIAGKRIDMALLAPGILVALGCLFAVYLAFAPLLHLWPHHDFQDTSKTRTAVAPLRRVRPPRTVVVRPKTLTPDQRVLIKVRPSKLSGIYDKYTALQAKQVMENHYFGRWVQLKGHVHENVKSDWPHRDLLIWPHLQPTRCVAL